MSEQRSALDVSHLPTTAFGQRDPMWWGVAGLITIESTVFALFFASLLVYRGNESVWPPQPLSEVSRHLALAQLVLLIFTAAVTFVLNTVTEQGRLRPMRLWLTVDLLGGAGCVAVRWFELTHLPFRWDASAYASTVWTLFGLHSVHLVSGLLENLMFQVLLFKGPIEEKHLVDLKLNGGYWYFVVASGAVIYAALLLDPGVWRG